MRELGELHGSASNLGDYIPILRWIDFLGVKKHMTEASGKIDRFMQYLLDVERSIRSSVPSANVGETGSSESFFSTIAR